MAKKHKKAKQQQQASAYGPGYGMGAGPGFGAADGSDAGNAGANPGWGQWGYPAAGQMPMGPDFQAGMANGFGGLAGSGWMQQLPAFLRGRNTEQFLIGALVGAAAAWVLSDDELRGKIVKSAMKMYEGVAGGFEEMKEQFADIRAEVQAQRQGEDD